MEKEGEDLCTCCFARGQQVEWNQQVAINGRVALTTFTREMKKKKVSRFVETINR